MHHDSPLLDVLILLAAAILVVTLFRRLRASSVLGYLMAGALVGPFALNLVRDVEGTRLLAEFGVVFLLFAIGLELSLERLFSLRRLVFGMGGLQVVTTALLFWGIARALGMGNGAAVVLGGGLALSSTAVVLQMMTERGEMAAPHGRLAFAVLLFQDLAVVPLLAIVPLLAEPGGNLWGAIAGSLLRALLAVGLILLAGRLVFRPALRLVASGRAPEIFIGITLLLVLGIGWLTEEAGLSMALGAFLAGLLIAETEFRHQAEADIEPFKGLLLGLFFMTVGMGLDLRLALTQAPLLLALVAGLIGAKSLVIALLGRLFGFAWGASLRGGTALAQGGEFAFVLFALAVEAGALSGAVAQLAILVVGFSMAVTPLLLLLGARLEGSSALPGGNEGVGLEETEDLHGHVLIAGYGRVGQTMARLLDAERIPYVALDLDAERVREERSQGRAVYFGDGRSREVLKRAGARRARAAVVTLDDPGAAERSLHFLRDLAPTLPVLVRAPDLEQCERLLRGGATRAIPEIVEGSLQLGEDLLLTLGQGREQARSLLEAFRAQAYARLSDLPAHGAPGGAEEASRR